MRYLLFTCLLFGFSQLASGETTTPFQVYTSFDSDTSALAGKRLAAALRPLGYQSIINLAPYKRSLSSANAQGDAELMRVAELKNIEPHLTVNLIQVPVPILENLFFLASTQDLPDTTDAETLGTLRLGIQKGILVLEEMFPDASLFARPSMLYELIRKKHLDVAIVGAHQRRVVESYPNYAPDIRLTLWEKRPLFLYIHKRHENLIPALTENLKRLIKEPAEPD